MRILLLALPGLGVLPACRPDSGLQKVNSLPEAQITAPSEGSAVLEGTTITLRGAASDPNHDAGELLARWFLGETEACASAVPAADGTTTCEVRVPAGDSFAARLEVVDPDGAAATASATWSVTPNAAPEVRIESPTADGVYYSDQLVILRATVGDVEDAADTLVVRWESSLDGALGEATPNSEGLSESFVNLGEGAHAVQAFVTDSAGNEGQATVLVDVGPPNSAPTCAITAPVDGSAGERGSTVTFRGSVADVDIPSDRLTVVWTSDKDGTIGTSTPTSGGSVTFPYADLSIDAHVVSMQVIDEVGATCTAEVLYTVGSPPVIALESPGSGEVVNEGDTVVFTALVSDGEDVAGELWVAWESSLDGMLYEGPPDSGGLAEFLDGTLTRGEHVLTATVTDTAGLYATARATFTVNGLPSTPGIDLAPSVPDTDDDLRVTIASPSVDPEGDPITYAYAWSRDGVPSTASTSSTVPASATTRGETWSVLVSASDGLGSGSGGSASVTIGNTAPSLASLALGPDPVYEDDVLVCVAGVTSDADGDTVGLTYDWYVDGVSLRQDTYSLDGSFFGRGDDVYCTATPTDGTDDGVTRSSNTVTVANSAPSLAGVSVTPSAPTAASTLSCAHTGFDDADGDPDASTYAWSVGGVVVGTGPTLAGAFVGGDVVTCTVTPHDGTDSGAAVSASVAVANTPPVLAGVSIAPAAAYNDELLTCVASATDVDGGTPTLTYVWTNTTTGASLGAGPTLSLTSASAASWDTVACAVTARDAAGGTDTASVTLTLGNRAPGATASLTPSAPTSRSTLNCGGSAVDPDGDGATITFSWTIDGVPVSPSSTSSTLSTLAGVFAAGQLVACTVTVNDGKTGTDTDSASVTIGNTAPVVSSVTLSPGTLYTNDTLTASVSASDADGDALSTLYDWYVDGALVQSGASATLSGATHFSRDQTVHVVATVDDSVATASGSSAGVTVLNTAPTAPVVAITPDDAASGDDLTCSVVTASADADGDPIAYTFAWDVDGVAHSGAADAATSSVVDGADVGGGETWTCEVVAGDGTDVTSVATTLATAAGMTWVLIDTETLTSLPSGSVTTNGAWLGQGVGAMGGRSCWRMRSDNNNVWMPLPIGYTTFDGLAVEVNMYVPSGQKNARVALGTAAYGTSSAATMEVLGSTASLWGASTYPDNGIRYGESSAYALTDVLSSVSSVADRWITVRMEVNLLSRRASYMYDGVTIGETILSATALVDPGYFDVAANTSCCSVPADVCYEGVNVYRGY